MARRLVYGPVASRRFGLSLGVDPVLPKTCSYDCAYCQQGRTTMLTTMRTDSVEPGEVLEQIGAALVRGPVPRVVTVAGSGEPTLYLSLGALIDGIHGMTDIPVVLLTNGSLLSDPVVRAAAGRADILGPSLDAGDEQTFLRINRPHPSIRFDEMVRGLREMRAEARGRFDLEVFLARGLNDSRDGLQELARLAMSMDPDSIQLNTAVRPVPGGARLALGPDEIEAIGPLFGPKARIIASFESWSRGTEGADPGRILAVLGRRPCTAAELATALGMDADDIARVLDGMERSGVLARTESGHYHPARAG